MITNINFKLKGRTLSNLTEYAIKYKQNNQTHHNYRLLEFSVSRSYLTIYHLKNDLRQL